MRKSNRIISPGIGVKIKHIWNHHLDNVESSPQKQVFVSMNLQQVFVSFTLEVKNH